MKRLPLLFTLLALIALAMSLAYWVLQLVQPPQRPLAAAPVAQMAEPSVDAAGTLFGGQATAAVATSYQLTGIVAAGRDSAAILVADGQPPRALGLGKEIAAGVSVAEIHPHYVMLSDGGVLKRIDLATDAKGGAGLSQVQSGSAATPPAMPPQTQTQTQAPPQPPPQPVQMPPPARVVAPGQNPTE